MLVITRVVVLAVIIGLWQLTAQAVGTFWVSSPVDVAERLWDWTVNGPLPADLAVTLEEMFLGFALAIIVGISVGYILGLSRLVGDALSPFIAAVYNLPILALVPLFILVFGIGTTSKIAIAFLAAFFVIFYNVQTGVRQVDQDVVNTLRVMGATTWQLTTKVLWPSTLQWLVAGLRLGIKQAFGGAVIGEIIASNSGVGYLIQFSSQNFDSTGVYAGLMYLVGIAVVLNVMLNWIERRYTVGGAALG